MIDVCLILEGTYPYVMGGVSSWLHQLIERMPGVRFGIVYFGARSDQLRVPKYKLPPNVVSFQETFLFDNVELGRRSERPVPAEQAAGMRELLGVLHADWGGTRAPLGFDEARAAGRALAAAFPELAGDRSWLDSLGNAACWRMITEDYARLGDPKVSFVDFFYNWRSAHIPLVRALETRIPRAWVYHSISTGYAGIAAAHAAHAHGSPLLLTEHGIYAHEREIELSEAQWMSQGSPSFPLTQAGVAALRGWWIQYFKNLSRVTYGLASQVVALYEGNRLRQLRDGCAPERAHVIPNGISPKLEGVRRRRPAWGHKQGKDADVFVLAFVGRVVAIKDVKTLIKTVHRLRELHPRVLCRVYGPTDEDPAYFAECQELVRVFGLESCLSFEGRRDIMEIYGEVDAVILSSIGEAQPLALLEANSAGLPVISTRVGCCDDLLNGFTAEDRAIGPSGFVVPVGDFEALAAQTHRLIRDPALWDALAQAGMERVRRFYRESDLISRYETMYQEHIARAARVSGLPPGVLPWQA